MSIPITALEPPEGAELDDEAILSRYGFPEDRPWLRMNFISSLDGAATLRGRSGGLGDEADRRVLDLLRWPADAIIVGAGTVRHEGYGAMRLAEAAGSWRTAHDLPPQPTFVVVSRSLNLDPGSPVFTDAPTPPIICTVHEAPEDRVAALSGVADIITAGHGDVDAHRIIDSLAGRGLHRLHAEGGPSLFGSFLAAHAVDELCLTLSPLLVAGDAPRITHHEHAVGTSMELVHVLRAGDELLLRYARQKPRRS